MSWEFVIDTIKEWVLSLGYATQAWVQSQGYLTTSYYHNPCALGWDYDRHDFVIPGDWNDLDVSAIVPEGTKAIHLYFRLKNEYAGQYVLINKPGEGAYGCCSYLYTEVANIRIGKLVIVTLSDDRKFSYKCNFSGAHELYCKIMGWWW